MNGRIVVKCFGLGVWKWKGLRDKIIVEGRRLSRWWLWPRELDTEKFDLWACPDNLPLTSHSPSRWPWSHPKPQPPNLTPPDDSWRSLWSRWSGNFPWRNRRRAHVRFDNATAGGPPILSRPVFWRRSHKEWGTNTGVPRTVGEVQRWSLTWGKSRVFGWMRPDPREIARWCDRGVMNETEFGFWKNFFKIWTKQEDLK